MADDENSIKVIFEADTSAVDTALKKTQSVAQKSARQISQQDKGSIKASGELIKNANKAVGIDTKLMKSGIKAAVLENKQFTTQKNQFKLQVGQHTRVGKLLTVQNKEQQKSLQLNSKLLKIDTNRYKTMKQLGSAWKSNQSAYAQMQAKRSTDAAAMQAIVGSRPPGSPTSPEEEEKKRKDKPSMDISNLLKGFANVAMQAIKFVTAPMTEAYQQYLQYGRTVGRTVGQGDINSVNFGRAEELLYSRQQTAEQSHGVARATGRLGATTTAQETSRFYGGSVEEATGYMGTLTRAGSRFSESGGGAGRTQLFRMIRDATASGLDRSRVGEHLDAVAGAVEATGGRTAGDVDVSNISGLLSFIGASGRSGFQGARGMGVLQSIDAGFRSGGRDESSEARQLAAYGFGVPGQDTDYFTARLRQDQGIFGGEGTQGAENLATLIQSFMATAQGNRDQAVLDATDSGLFGDLGENQIKALFETFNASGGNINTMAAAIDDLRESQGSIEEQIRDNLKSGQAEVASVMVKLDNRMVELGRQLFPSVTRIQNAIVSLQDSLFPAALAVLNFIAESIDAIRQGLSGIPGWDNSAVGPQVHTATEQRVATLSQESAMSNDLAQLRANLQTVHELNRRAEQTESNLWRDVRTTGNGRQYAQRYGMMTDRMQEDEREIRARIAQVERERAAVDRALPALPVTPSTTVNVAPAQANVTVNVPAAEPANARIPVNSGGNTGVRGGSSGW